LELAREKKKRDNFTKRRKRTINERERERERQNSYPFDEFRLFDRVTILS